MVIRISADLGVHADLGAHATTVRAGGQEVAHLLGTSYNTINAAAVRKVGQLTDSLAKQNCFGQLNLGYLQAYDSLNIILI